MVLLNIIMVIIKLSKIKEVTFMVTNINELIELC